MAHSNAAVQPQVPMPRDLEKAISDLSVKNSGDLQIVDVLKVAELSLRSVKALFSTLDDMVYAESTMLAAYLSDARKNFLNKAPQNLRTKDLPSANEELIEVVRNTEAAANTIMETAEAILCQDPAETEDYPAYVQEQMLAILEACSFQDLTGQRISKVSETITDLSGVIADLVEAIGRDPDAPEHEEEKNDRDQWKEENLLHGPQKSEEAKDQDAIDALFDQSDIDALFD